MVLKQQGAAWGAVQVWLPDEQETDILAGTLDHTLVTYGMFSDVDTFARRRGLDWAVRPETQVLYPRANGSTGSFYPDLLVALGVVLGSTEPYRVTAVGKAPEFIMETLSPHTETNDTREQDGKIDAYAQLGVYEYLIVDPGLHGAPRMVGRRLLAPGRYALIPAAPDGGLWLESLGLWITLEAGDGTVVVGPRLRLSTAGGERLPHLEEEAAELQRERRARIEAEHAQRHAEEGWQREAAARQASEERERQEAAARLVAEETLQVQQKQMDALRTELARLHTRLDANNT